MANTKLFPFLSRDERIALYGHMLDELSEETPRARERSKGVDEAPLGLHAKAMRARLHAPHLPGAKATQIAAKPEPCPDGDGDEDMNLAFKNPAFAAKATVCVHNPDVQVHQIVHDPTMSDDPGSMAKHRSELQDTVTKTIQKLASKYGPKNIKFVDSDHSSQPAPAPTPDPAPASAEDPRADEPLSCIKCGTEKKRRDFSNKTYNLKFSPSHPAYGKKQTCKACDRDTKKAARKAKNEAQKVDPADAELPTDPEDMIEPFNGLAKRTGDDEPTLVRFNPTRMYLQNKPPLKTRKRVNEAKKTKKKIPAVHTSASTGLWDTDDGYMEGRCCTCGGFVNTHPQADNSAASCDGRCNSHVTCPDHRVWSGSAALCPHCEED